MLDKLKGVPLGYYFVTGLVVLVLIPLLVFKSGHSDEQPEITLTDNATVIVDDSSAQITQYIAELNNLKANYAILQAYYETLKQNQANYNEQISKAQQSQASYETAQKNTEALYQQYMSEFNEYPILKAQEGRMKQDALKLQVESEAAYDALINKLEAVNNRTDNITNGITDNLTATQVDAFYKIWNLWYHKMIK